MITEKLRPGLTILFIGFNPSLSSHDRGYNYAGKGVYQACIGKRLSVPWGFAVQNIVSGVRDFIAPATSGLVRMRIEEQTAIFRMLAGNHTEYS